MPNAWPYVRVSSDPQHESGLGEEAQRQMIADYYDRVLQPQGVDWGYTDSKGGRLYFEDPAESAYQRMFLERPQGRQLFLRVRPGDYLIVAALDRGFRNTVDCLQTENVLRTQGAFLVLVNLPGMDTSTAIGRLLLTMLAAQAEFQSAMAGERMRHVHKVLIAQGKVIGGSVKRKPWGYFRTEDNRLIPDQAERQIMEVMVRYCRIDYPGCSWSQCYRHLRSLFDRGVLDPSLSKALGRKWNEDAVRNIVPGFWRICRREGVAWINDPVLRQYAERKMKEGVVAR